MRGRGWRTGARWRRIIVKSFTRQRVVDTPDVDDERGLDVAPIRIRQLLLAFDHELFVRDLIHDLLQQRID